MSRTLKGRMGSEWVKFRKRQETPRLYRPQLLDWTVSELREKCDEFGIEFLSRDRKDDLIDKLVEWTAP